MDALDLLFLVVAAIFFVVFSLKMLMSDSAAPAKRAELARVSNYTRAVARAHEKTTTSPRQRGLSVASQVGRSMDRLAARGELTSAVQEEINAVADSAYWHLV